MGMIDWKQMNERSGKLLESLDIHVPPTQMLEECSIAIQQMIAIARAVDMKCQVLILISTNSFSTSSSSSEDVGSSRISTWHFMSTARELRSSAESQWNIHPASVLAAHECPGSQEVFLSAHSSASNQSFPSFSVLCQ